MPLFEVAILEKPTKKEVEEGTGKERLVFGPKPVIAGDSQAAAIGAVMENKETLSLDLARMEVLVRPFA